MKGFSVAALGIVLLSLPSMRSSVINLCLLTARDTQRDIQQEKLMKENPDIEIGGEITFSCGKS